MFEDLDLAQSEVLYVFAVVAYVDELAGMTLVVVAIEQRLLILEMKRGNEKICSRRFSWNKVSYNFMALLFGPQ